MWGFSLRKWAHALYHLCVFPAAVLVLVFIHPQAGNIEVPLVTTPPSLDNCMFLDPSLQLKWLVNRAESTVMFQLCGCLSSSAE